MIQLITYKYNDGNIIGGVRTNTATLDTDRCTLSYLINIFEQHFSTFEVVSVEDITTEI
jgi:hypothetical protein